MDETDGATVRTTSGAERSEPRRLAKHARWRVASGKTIRRSGGPSSPTLPTRNGTYNESKATRSTRRLERISGGIQGSVVTVILTDDTHRMEVREAVRAARRHSEHVLVFLAPTVLFERGGIRTVETAYEELRRFRGVPP